MKISDIIWAAANDHLWDWVHGIAPALREMGVDTGSMDEFDEFEREAERQGARYAWLMFVYDLAIERGL